MLNSFKKEEISKKQAQKVLGGVSCGTIADNVSTAIRAGLFQQAKYWRNEFRDNCISM